MRIFDILPRPAIIAHRGASAHAPENTLAAFQLALEQRADGIELDAMLTVDDQIVVFHDATVDRVTGASGRVKNMTLAELQKLDAGSHFDLKYKGEPIPTLAEVFESVGRLTFINIELKNYDSPGDDLPERACALIKEHSLEGQVMFSSFNPLALIKAHKHLPMVPCGLLTFPGRNGGISRSRLGWLLRCEALHPYVKDTTTRLVQREHRKGKKVNVWTVDQPEEIQRMASLQVDGIITDDPVMARNVMEGI